VNQPIPCGCRDASHAPEDERSELDRPTVSEPRVEPVRLGLLTVVLATACGLAVANIYFAQPILSLLADSFHTSQSAATLAVTIVQVGYAIGLVMLLPMGTCSRTDV
jgi:predicted MFS family arabinose efflux permease